MHVGASIKSDLFRFDRRELGDPRLCHLLHVHEREKKKKKTYQHAIVRAEKRSPVLVTEWFEKECLDQIIYTITPFLTQQRIKK